MNALLIDAESVDAARRHKHVLDLLDQVLAQRPTLKLECAEGATPLNNVTASMLSHCSSGVTLDIASLEGISQQWVGAEVTCLFRLYEKSLQEGAHMLTFSSRIVSVQRQQNEVVTLALALPESIERVQRRRSVRVDVSQDKVPSIKVWPELATGAPVARKTPLLDSEDSAQQGLRVNNISATGISLYIADALMLQALPRRNTGQRYSLYFTAISSAECPAAHFWVNAALRNIIDRPKVSEVCLGFEFLAEGELDEAKRIVWQPLKFDEVSGLGKFIFKWNLDNSREKPLIEC